MSNQSCKIYLVTHKKYDFPEEDIFVPLMVNADNQTETYGYLCDNTGTNISSKNDLYSELTGMYWIWKNAKDDIVGLNHYRRIFASKHNIDGYITKSECLKEVNDNKIIIHKKELGMSVYQNFSNIISEKALNDFINEFLRVYPSYKKELNAVLEGHTLYNCNMFVSNHTFLDNYCEWLFKYMESVEENLTFDKKRIYGYFSEICLHVYILHQNIQVTNYPVNYIEGSSNRIANLIDSNNLISKIYNFYWNLFHK